MHPDNNPLLQPEDYMQGYTKSIEDLKNRPEIILFDKLCYEVFNTEMGLKLLHEITERYLLRPSTSVDHPNFSSMCVWGEGYKSAFLTLIQSVRSHEQRIQAGKTE